MLRRFSVTLLLLALLSPALAQKRPTSFIEKRVTFAIPGHWKIQAQEDTKTLAAVKAESLHHLTCTGDRRPLIIAVHQKGTPYPVFSNLVK
jgi:hypothetical protein